MNFNTIFLKSFRVLLLPLAVIYGFIIFIRNRLYDRNYLKSAAFNFPLICVGNLAVGGTGKSPMVEYLIELLKPRFRIFMQTFLMRSWGLCCGSRCSRGRV